MYFQDSYENSRQAFVERARTISKKNPGSQWKSIKNSTREKEDLFTDIMYKMQGDNRVLVMITSGVHGIEGYTGSAVQNMLADEFITGKNLPFDVLMIHSINPFGHKYFRRVNENNVDLNRHFVASENFFRSTGADNPAYEKFNAFLNPSVPYHISAGYKWKFTFKTLQIVMRQGIKSFRQAVLQGQYKFEKGIFFGGKIFQNQKQIIDRIWEEFVPRYDEIVLVDIHTGYGFRGQLHLIGMDDYPEISVYEKLKKIYSGLPLEKADKDQGNFYKIHGALFEYLYEKGRKAGKTVLPLAWEFGTNDNIKTLQSIESLRIVRAENQVWHYGATGETDRLSAKKEFRELFYPSDPAWQKKVLELSRDAFGRIIDFYKV
jgi:hypothetical protein